MNPGPYDTVAAAERALIAAGYHRDASAAVWVNGNQRAKVTHNPADRKFYISAK